MVIEFLNEKKCLIDGHLDECLKVLAQQALIAFQAIGYKEIW